jgi:ribosomal protein L11 methyltransferase
MANLLKIDFRIPGEHADAFTAYLFDKARHGWEEELEPSSGKPDFPLFRVFFDNRPLAAEVMEEVKARWPGAQIATDEVEEQNWALAWREFFTPVVIGETFEILPPWLARFRDPDKTAIIIDPNMAFGTGHHPTTALCLEMVADMLRDGLVRSGMSFLDLGTGTGVLGIGCAKKGLSGLGLDIDPQAVSCAEENIDANGVGDRFTVRVGSIGDVDPEERFDLVLANILAEPLMDLAPDIVAHMARGGRLVLSGLLAIQADRVAETYRLQGLPEPCRKISGEWAALIW